MLPPRHSLNAFSDPRYFFSELVGQNLVLYATKSYSLKGDPTPPLAWQYNGHVMRIFEHGKSCNMFLKTIEIPAEVHTKSSIPVDGLTCSRDGLQRIKKIYEKPIT